MNNEIHILSLGAGVQSSAMALMASCGEITPMPVAAIFADTQNEPKSIYEWLDWLEPQLSFPIYWVTAGNLGQIAVQNKSTKKGHVVGRCSVPAFIKSPESYSILPKHCTRDFKISILRKKSKELMKSHGKKRVVVWIGISLDEIYRVKSSNRKFIEHRFPLIDMRMRRYHCLNWMKLNNYPEPTRSACEFCPFHSDKEWLRLKTKEPESFLRAIQFEEEFQRAYFKRTNKSSNGAIPYLHRSFKSIGTVDFDPCRDQADMFVNECEGMCGV